jgi:hypothetical protein
MSTLQPSKLTFFALAALLLAPLSALHAEVSMRNEDVVRAVKQASGQESKQILELEK